MKAREAYDTAREYGTSAVNQARDYGTSAVSHAREYGNTALHSAEDYGAAALDTVEETVSGIPANAFLTAAFASIGISLALKLSGRDRDAKFVGHWAPTFVGLAVFSKLVEHARSSKH